MKKFLPLFLLGILLYGLSVFHMSQAFVSSVRADDQIDALQRQIEELSKLKKMSEDATKPLEKEVQGLEAKIASAKAGIAAAQKKSEELGKTIDDREATLGLTYKLFSTRVAERYRDTTQWSPLTVFLANQDASLLTKTLVYHDRAVSRDQGELKRLSAEITQFEADKKQHEATKQKLIVLQKQLDDNASFFKGEIAKAKKYQTELSGKIADLSEQQRKILAEKTGTATTSVGDVPLADDPNSRPTFNPGFSPAFAAFSFGAPHFKGMSQYGAFGRAKSGQNYETILRAYYGDIEIRKTDMPGNITVDGVGSIPFDGQYVKGIAEMPGSWADNGGYEALKAQAIAARTYALSYTGWTIGSPSIKRSICATESCQVYKTSKYQAGGRWADAVQETQGMVIVSKKTGNIFSTQYASTSGGYQLSYSSMDHTTPGLWDTTSDWTKWADGAYESKAGSPWFYKGWYKSRSGDTCGRSHPWLTQDEFADILNAWVVRYKGDGGAVSRVTPLGSCYGGSPFSIDEMRSKANELGGAFTSISSVRMEHGSDGYTKNVVVQSNRGEVRIPGAEFKTAFNLRAPGRISIKSNLFGIEKK